jgi:hypothetical protein
MEGTNEMPKQTTTCHCGGTWDGTPSGFKRHEASTRHQAWDALMDDATNDPDVEVIEDQGIGGGLYVTHPGTPEPTTLREQFAALPPRFRKWGLADIALDDAKRAIEDAKAAVKEAEAGLRWRQKHNTDNAALLAKWAEKVTNAMLAQADAANDLTAAQLHIDVEKAAIDSEWRAFWSKVDAEVQEQFQRDSDVYIRPMFEGSYEVSLTTGKINERHTETCASRDGKDCDCEMVVWPEKRFGFEVQVGVGRANYTEPYLINWGGIGAKTIDEAKDFARLIGLAVDVAAFLTSELL